MRRLLWLCQMICPAWPCGRKEAEDRFAAAKTQARERLEQDVQHARESTQTAVDKLRGDSTEVAGRVQAWGDEVQRSWNDYLTQVHQRLEDRKARREAKIAERDAQSAESYAEFAIDVAYSAIEEAEYAVLDAALARMDADSAAVSN